MEEDYEYLGQYYDDWEQEEEPRANEVDKRLQYADGYIDPRSYNTYDAYHIGWLQLAAQLDMFDEREQEDQFSIPSVKNHNWEKLDNLPKHERLWERDGYVKYKYRTPYKIEKAYKIFKASEGRPLSSLRRRLKPLLKSRRTFNSVLRDWSEVVQFNEDGSYTILDMWGAPGNRWKEKHGNYHYVDTEDKLQYIPRVKDLEKEARAKETRIRNTAWIKRREQDIKEKAKAADFILEHINKPVIIQFYKDLLSKRDSIIHGIREWEDFVANPPAKSNKWAWMFRPFKPSYNSYKELVVLKDKVQRLQSGDLTPFYTSVNYLYSIGKECPHFENTQT